MAPDGRGRDAGGVPARRRRGDRWGPATDQQRFQDASPILFADEQNVFSETAAYPLPHGSTTLLDRSPDACPNAAERFDRLHVHFVPRDGGPAGRAEVAAFLTRLGRDFVASFPDELVKLRLHAPEPHDNSTPNPPAPNVEHTVADHRVELVVLEMAFSDALARRQVFASPIWTAAQEEYERVVRGVKAFQVEGVYTYIRDGELTTTGLRGSRAAELINSLAALNQTASDVRCVMLHGEVDPTRQ